MGEDLVGKSEYKKYQGISSTNQDDIINILIPKVSEFVKNYCNRTFIDYAFDYKTEVFNGDAEYFILSEPPILEISSFEYSSDYGQTYTELIEYTDWILKDELIIPLSSTGLFAKAINGYKVVYRGGYEEVPEDLKLAVMDLINYYIKNEGTVKATRFSNTTSMQIEYISDASLPAYIRRVLDNYILHYA